MPLLRVSGEFYESRGVLSSKHIYGPTNIKSIGALLTPDIIHIPKEELSTHSCCLSMPTFDV